MWGDTSTERGSWGWQVLAGVSQPFSGSLSLSQWPGWQEMTRQVPPRQAESAWGVLHWTPQTPQFWASSASTASQSLAGFSVAVGGAGRAILEASHGLQIRRLGDF